MLSSGAMLSLHELQIRSFLVGGMMEDGEGGEIET